MCYRLKKHSIPSTEKPCGTKGLSSGTVRKRGVCNKNMQGNTNFLLYTTSLINPHAKKPHFHRNVTTFLDETFLGRWVGRRGSTAWPPRSPDLTPLDFFAWGLIKDVVYRRKKFRDLADLRQRIIEAVELITCHMPINTWQKLENRLDICRATTGAHNEVY
jgi:hypothetical protein